MDPRNSGPESTILPRHNNTNTKDDVYNAVVVRVYLMNVEHHYVAANC